jgi:tetratricopeptide (TPR) repeat protein
MYKFERATSYATARRRAAETARRRDARVVLEDAKKIRAAIEGARADAMDRARDGDEDERDDDDVNDARRALDDVEAALREDAEASAREGLDEAKRDAEVRAMTAAAEARDRDPRVVELMEDARNAMVAPEGAPRARAAAVAFAEKVERALAIEPEYYEASLQLGAVYRAQGYVARGLSCVRSTYEHTPSCVAAYVFAGRMCEDLGLYNHAEEEYAKCVNVAFDYPDAWIALARLMCVQFGAIASAVKLMRLAKSGGPEGKFVRPGKHPLLLFTLAHALHLNGYAAEPTSLYTQALHAGAGIMAVYPLARLACDGGDDESVEAYREMWRNARESVAEAERGEDSLFASLDMFNSVSHGAHWHELLTSKTRAHEAIAQYDGTGAVSSPTLVTSENIDENLSSGDANRLYVLKGEHVKFPGLFKQRKNRIGTLAYFREEIIDSSSRRSRGGLIAQRRVDDCVTDELGRKCSVRVRAAFVPDREPSFDVAYIAQYVSLHSAVREYGDGVILGDEYDDELFLREFTNRGLSGDEASAVVREVDIDDLCARLLGLDDISKTMIAQCQTVVRAFRARVREERNVIQDSHYAGYAAVGAPVFFELEFVIENGEKPLPWLIGVHGEPRFALERERAFVHDVWSRTFDGLDGSGSQCRGGAVRDVVRFAESI